MTIARLVYAEVRGLAARPFVESAVGLGVPGFRILMRHILPNALTPVIVAAALGLGNAILLEAGLSFLGLGVQPPTPSWGNLIASGRDTLINAPWVAAAPGWRWCWSSWRRRCWEMRCGTGWIRRRCRPLSARR